MTSRRLALVAAALAAVLVLSGCVSWFKPPRVTSTPTDETIPAALAPFYHQVLAWTSCGNSMQCAEAKAPLDWSDPAKATIQLALVRQVAKGGKSLGSLLVNPGGPGASGYDFVKDSIDYATSSRLQSSYDIVGFDPRGVNRSTPIRCYSTPSQLDAFLFTITKGTPGSDSWIAASMDSSRKFGADCLKYSGDLLGHVDTISAARDLDMLRAALGDKKLNYLGYSYGTLLGATYAQLYPEKTGRLVFDGVVDPTVTPFELSATQAKGFESALRAFLVDCPTMDGCPFQGSVDESMKTIRSLLDNLDLSPLRNKDGRELGSATMFTAIILPLYSKDTWPALVKLFTQVMKGDPSYAFVLADFYYDRNSDGTYSDNLSEANIAIDCLDYPTDSNVTDMRSEAARLDKLAPVFGHLMAYGGTGCADWPFPPTATRGPITAAGSSDILVLGTTNDPATPYVWSQSLASQLQNGHLVTYQGEGHTAYNKSNACVNTTVDDYFINGTVPTADPKC